MPEIRPFRAIRYNQEKIPDLTQVVTQPYDKINPDLQDRYYRRSPYSYVRLILGKIEPSDDDRNNRYTRAKKTFEDWCKGRVLIQDPEPGLYPYHQEFQIGDKTYLRRGFIGILRLEEFGGKILPHERTLSKPKEDRLKLLQTTMKNFETVFMLYTDPEHKVSSLLDPEDSPPLIEAKDDFNFSHRLWKVTDPEIIRAVQAVFADSTLFVADGHHRYETSLNLMKEIGGEGPHSFRQITFVDIEDPGLIILPTHRLIFNIEFDLERIKANLSQFFMVQEIDRSGIEARLKGRHRFILLTRDSTLLLELKDEKVMDRILPDRSEVYRRLDVTILHSLVIEKTLGVNPERIEDHVRYAREIEKVLSSIDSEEFQIGLLLNPTTAEEVKAVASVNERMPQKSTDFFPKMISGLTIYDLAS